MSVGIAGLCLHAQRRAPDGLPFGRRPSAQGPEGGVWVIAETKDLPTNFIKIVVTDDQGRFMLPELPPATYRVWVRGYGLVDSTAVETKPRADSLTLTAIVAKTPLEAAQVYPGNYWLRCSSRPRPKSFRDRTRGQRTRTGDADAEPLDQLAQIGLQLLPSARQQAHAQRRPRAEGEAGAQDTRRGVGMAARHRRPRKLDYAVINNQGKERSLKAYADWTERVAKGDVPPAPSRPSGVERNLVVTLWDVGDDHSFMHDEISTDKNHPTVNANGRVYAVSAGHGQLVVLDPNENSTVALDIPTREAKEKVPSRFPAPNRPSLHWGNEHLWANPPYDPADPHNPMLDSKGRVWMTSKIRSNADPSWCSDATNKFADWFPLAQQRPAGVVLRSEDEQVHADRHVLQHASSAVRHRSQRDGVFQRADRSDVRLDRHEGVRPDAGRAESGGLVRPGARHQRRRQDHQAVEHAGGTRRRFSDVSGRHAWRAGRAAAPLAGAPGAPAGRGARRTPRRSIRSLDTMVSYSMYAVIPSPVDDTVWGVSERFPGILIRLQRGSNPPVDVQDADLQSARARLRSARRGHRQPRRRVDGARGEQSSRELRRAQVHGPRTAPRRPTAASAAKAGRSTRPTGPKLQGHGHSRRLPLLQLGGSAQHLGLRRRHAVRHRLELRRAAGAESADARVDHASRAVSARLLLARHGRPHRRCQRRMEGPRAVRELRHALRLAHRGRQRAPRARSSVPDSAEPAGSLRSDSLD